MKVIRCKDCALDGCPECPLAYIEHQTLCFIEHPPMFFCGKAKPKDDYTPTKGDILRNMTDRQLAEYISRHECEAFKLGAEGGYMKLGKENEDFWAGFLKAHESEDF